MMQLEVMQDYNLDMKSSTSTQATAKLTSMLIKTPERELALFAISRKSDNFINCPAFWFFGFRNNLYLKYGLEI